MTHVANVTHLGHCVGCETFGVVEHVSGVCARCLFGPRRGLKWALMMDRCRREPRWARAVYDRIISERGRRTFIEIFGLPPRFDADDHDRVEAPPSSTYPRT